MEQNEIIDLMSNLPTLNPLKFNSDTKYRFPYRATSQLGRRAGDSHPPVSEVVDLPYLNPKNGLEKLVNALVKASRKLEYTRTSIDDWERTLVFTNDRVVRKRRQMRLRPSDLDHWVEDEPINVSLKAAQDWFDNYFVPSFTASTEGRHSAFLVGDPGSGKSSLVKYLLARYYATPMRRSVIFSRFEFRKFWHVWRKKEKYNESLNDYISYVHLRDTLIGRFIVVKEGKSFVPLGAQYLVEGDRIPKDLRRNNAMDDVHTGTISMKARARGITLNAEDWLSINEIRYSCSISQEKLSAAIVNASTQVRRLLTSTFLPEGRHLVTVFDGLDSIEMIDAIDQTDEFQALCDVLMRRRELSAASLLEGEKGRNFTGSLAVIRNSTLGLIESRGANNLGQLSIGRIYKIGRIDPTAASISLISRARREVEQEIKGSSDDWDPLRFEYNLLSIVFLFMVVLHRNSSPIKSSDRVLVEVFDGDLRELFKFVSSSVARIAREMLSREVILVADLKSPYSVASALMSRYGRSYIRQRRYRIVEFLLHAEGKQFENAFVVENTSDLDNLGGGTTVRGGLLRSSGLFTSHFDNIFSYIEPRRTHSADSLNLLEKVRIVQIAADRPSTKEAIFNQMRAELGYGSDQEEVLIRILLKTGMLTPDPRVHAGTVKIVYAASNRARFLLRFLLSNLTYLENVYHRTLLPEALLSRAEDQPRSTSVAKWTAASIANVYVLLTYIQFVENNRPGGGKSVPRQFRIFERVHGVVLDALRRIVAADESSMAALSDAGESVSSSEILQDALNKIKTRRASWQRQGLVVRAP